MKNKKCIVFILLLSMLLSSVSPAFALPETNSGISSGSIGSFNDINNHWAKNAVEKWTGYGVLSGYQGLFRPDDSITRGEMAVILDNMMDYQILATNKFSDLPSGQFFSEPMLKANAAGIIRGDGSMLRPLDKITREEASVMMARAFAVKESNGSSKFNDAASIASWANGYVISMAEQGYVKGSNNNFYPKAKITRAEIVTIINNIVKAYYTKAGTYTENVEGTAIIKVADVILKGSTVTGNLIIAEGVGDGDATLDGVTVKGETVVRGGGENSVHITGNSNITSVRIEKINDKIRIVVTDGSTVKEVEVTEGEEIIITGKVGTLDIVAADTKIIAKEAEIGAVTVQNSASNTSFNVESGTKVGTITASAPTMISGTGNVASVVLNQGANNSSITTPKTQTTVSSGVTGVTGGGGTAIPQGSVATNNASGNGAAVQSAQTVPGGGGGGSTGGSSTVAVSSIAVTSNVNYVAVGTTLQMNAVITPSNATDKTVTWSVPTLGGIATIANTGLLTATTEGTIRVTAINAASGVSGYKDITVMTVAAANQLAVSNAKTAIEGATYIMTEISASSESVVKSSIETLISGLNLNGVTTTVNAITYTPAISGSAIDNDGTNGSYQFSVSLSKGATTDTTTNLAMTITATPFDWAAQNIILVGAAKTKIEGATFTASQSAISTEADARAAVLSKIIALGLDGVTVAAINGNYVAPTAGTYSNPNGTDGSYTFTVNLTKGAASATTVSKTLMINATVFDVAAADQNSVNLLKTAIEAATFTTAQAILNSEANAQVMIRNQVTALGLDGVTLSAITGSFTAAIAGTSLDHDGTNGIYTFTIDLAKNTASGSAANTLVITATPYDSDAADVAAVKLAIESETYSTSQAIASSASNAQAAVRNQILALGLNGVTITAITGTFAPATEGTYSSPSGINGSYAFTVGLKKGAVNAVTASRTMTIAATVFDVEAADQDAVTDAAILIGGKTFSIPHASANTMASAAGIIQTTISALQLNGVTATVTALSFNDASDGTLGDPDGTPGEFVFFVYLEKGDANATVGTYSAIVIPLPYDSTEDDLQKVTDAKDLLEIEVFTIPHTSANTVASASGIIKTNIDEFPELDGISTSVSTVSFVDAMDGTSSYINGTPGAFEFRVTLTKNSATTITSILTATITPEVFDVAAADLQSVTQARDAILDASDLFTMTQAEATTESAVLARIGAIIDGLDLRGSSRTIIKHGYLEAIAGSLGDADGTNGSYGFEVVLTKGDATASAIMTMIVEATSFAQSDKMTIMVYADGDNDLESYLIQDINEMKLGVTDDVNLITLVDRIGGGSDDTGAFGTDFTDTRLYQIKKNNAIRLSGDSENLSFITTSSAVERNMGDPELLKQFIDYCKVNYPADKTVLILWNHGGGARTFAESDQNSVDEKVKAICWDETVIGDAPVDCLYTAEVTDCLGDDESVDIIGFDACLMGSIEVAYQYRPRFDSFGANTMIGSAPNVWGTGWKYDEILKRLDSTKLDVVSADSDTTLGTAAELYYDPASITNELFGAIVVEEQKDSTTGVNDQSLACYDLAWATSVKAAVDDLAIELATEYPTTSSAVAVENIRDMVIPYFSKASESEWINTPFFDLYDFADKLSGTMADSTQADELKEAIDNFIKYSYAGSSFVGFENGRNGVSIFIPDGDRMYTDTDGDYPHWAYQWWYNAIDTAVLGEDSLYGRLDWCRVGASPATTDVTNWFELLDDWYDEQYATNWNGYQFVDPDDYASDDPESATPLTEGEYPTHTIYPSNDVDWFTFTGEAGRLYTIETEIRSNGMDTYLYLYGDLSEDPILSNDDDAYGENGLGSRIVFDCTSSGAYYLKVVHFENRIPKPEETVVPDFLSIGWYDIVVTSTAISAGTLRVEADPEKGFNYDYLIYVPSSFDPGVESTMIVEMLNTGRGTTSIADALNEGPSVLNPGRAVYQISNALKSPIIVPCIERPEEFGWIYTHALDRDSIFSDGYRFSAVDEQVKNMIIDARNVLEDMYVTATIDDKVFMNGFSASGQFAHRFTVLHPEMVKASAAGGLGGMITIPETDLEGNHLIFPIGVADLATDAGITFNKADYLNVPQYIYQGELDDNQPILYPDSYSDEERDLIYSVLGGIPTDNNNLLHFMTSKDLNTSAGAININFVVYDDIGHTYNSTVITDIITFFNTVLAGE